MKTRKLHSFNPFKFIKAPKSSSKETAKPIYTPEEEVVAKGQTKVFKLDLGKFSRLCKKFKDMEGVYIRNLKGSNKEDFNLVVSLIHLFYGTNYYKKLFRKVEKYFGNLHQVTPGTIGGYFGGCLAESSYSEDNPGCSVSCAGSIPRPKDEEGWSFCDKAVILAEEERDTYKFTLLKEPEDDSDMSPCYLFVRALDLHEFKGFSSKEMDKLNNLGCTNVHLIGYDSDGLTYVDLYDDPIDIYEIKYRPVKKNGDSTTLAALALVLVILFLLLIVAYYGWKLYQC